MPVYKYSNIVDGDLGGEIVKDHIAVFCERWCREEFQVEVATIFRIASDFLKALLFLDYVQFNS